MNKLLSGLPLLLLLAACNPPAPLTPDIVVPAEPGLSPAEISREIVGNTGMGQMSGTQAVYSMYLAPDGTALAKLPTGMDTGRWRIADDGTWCVRWEKFRGGQEYCQRIYKRGDVYRFVNSGLMEDLRLIPGKAI